MHINFTGISKTRYATGALSPSIDSHSQRTYLVTGVSYLVLRIPTSTIKAEEMKSFSAVRHAIKWHVAEATLTFHKHPAVLMFFLVELGS
jgi:hypothetical protein